MKQIILLVFLLSTKAFSGDKFSDAEASFKQVMQKILDQHVDSDISKEDLYKAATAGMLSSLNKNDKDWNKLLSPTELKNMQDDLSGKVSGVGIAIRFDETDKFPLVMSVIPNTPAFKAGLRAGDYVLSVDGKKYVPKQFVELVNSIRGETGKTVTLKILRGEEVVPFKVKREVVPFDNVEFEKINDKSAYLDIGYFTNATPKAVEAALKKFNDGGFTNLIIDLRGNSGGAFESAVKTSALFVPQGALVASTKNRSGKEEKFFSEGRVLKADVPVFILTDKETSSGAELFVAAVKESCNAKVVGTPTLGKWNAQKVESLANKYAYKFTVQQFFSPKGNSYQDKGIIPDVEVDSSDSKRLQEEMSMSQRLEKDRQLKAALHLASR